MLTPKQLHTLMLNKAKGSLLSPKDVAQLKFQVFTEEQSQKLDIFPKWAGFQIPYFDLKGKTTEFFRFRYLQDRPSTGFAALGDPVGKVRRYGQPSGSGSHVYLPPLLDQSWAEIAADPSVSLVITEGELKAACACSLGVPCIGLGGVYNWRAGKQGQELIPDLEAFRWEDRHLVLCFDSDVSTNHMVRSALA